MANPANNQQQADFAAMHRPLLATPQMMSQMQMFQMQQLQSMQQLQQMHLQQMQQQTLHNPLFPYGMQFSMVNPFVTNGTYPSEMAEPAENADEGEDEVDDEKQRTLFVANLDDRITDDLLYEVFIQAGPIESVRIPKDKTGHPRTFAFVTYVHACTPEYAMQLFQGLQLFRRNLQIRLQGVQQDGPANNHHQRHSQQQQDNHRDQGHQQRRSGGGGDNSGPNKFDNSAMRSGNFAAFAPASPTQTSTPSNPFRMAPPTQSSATSNSPSSAGSSVKDWTSGSVGRRSDKRTQPYERDSPRHRNPRNSSRDSESNARKRTRGHYKDGNRQSNQRNNRI